MRLRSTTPAAQLRHSATRAGLFCIAFVMAVAGPLQFSQVVSAVDYDARIRELQGEIDQYQARASELSSKANTLQAELDRLTNEKIALQRQIDLKQAEYERVVGEIAKNEEKLNNNQSVLGDTLSNLYVDDKVSALEMLASSENIGEYVDKQEYRSAVREQLTQAIDEIKRLKKELEKQKQDAENILTDQKAQREVLAGKEAEQQHLVSETRGEEAAYQGLASDRMAKKNEVQRQQQAAIEAALRRAGAGGRAVAGDPGKGGYPNYLATSDYYNPVVDPWGMYSRQCVSYTAWRVFQKNGYMAYWGGRGNANQWPANARAAGIGTGSTPRAGSVGVMMAGQYGHVVWVESVNGDGTINISQYNYYNAGGSGWGHYSEMYGVPASAYDVYIYF